MALVLIKDSLERLDYLEEQTKHSSSSSSSFSDSMKDQIQTLQIELKFLRLFFKFIEVKNIEEDEGLKEEVSQIEGVIQDVGEAIHSRYVEVTSAAAKEEEEEEEEEINGGNCLAFILDKIELKCPRLFFKRIEVKHIEDSSLDGNWLTYILNKIDDIKPLVDQSYYRISQLYNNWDLRESDEYNRLIEYVLENLKDLIESSEIEGFINFQVKKLLESLERKLLFLQHSLQFIVKVSSYTWPVIFNIIHVTVTAASFFFHRWFNKMDTIEVADLYGVLNYSPHLEETTLYSILSRPQIKDWIANYIDFLVQRLGEVLSRDGSLESQPAAESLYNELKFLRSFLIKIPPQAADHGISYEQQLKHQIKLHLNKAGRLVEDLYVGIMNKGKLIMINDSILSQVLGRLKLTNIFCRMELVHYEANFLNLRDDHQFEALLEDMRLLRTFYFERYNYEDPDPFMRIVVFEAGSLIYSLSDNKITAEEMRSRLPDLLAKIKLIKADMRKIYPRATVPYNFPKTDGQRGMAIFLKDLNELLNSRFELFDTIPRSVRDFSKHWIKNIHNELDFLIPYLEKFEEKGTGMGELEALERDIKNVTNEANYVTGTSFLKYHPLWYCMLKFSDVMEKVKLIKKEIGRTNEKLFGKTLSTQDNTLTMGELIVGFDDEEKKIFQQLVGGSKNLHVISIVGMGGLGKSTLTRKLYDNPLVSGHFHRRAMSCVSQVFQKRELLLDILRQVDDLTRENMLRLRKHVACTNADLENMLRQSLKGNRYLIVLDDIWDIKAFTALRRCFDDDGTGSRIVFTTRNRKVAMSVSRKSIHLLRYFNDQESLELLLKTLFPRKRCPREELEIVKQIAKHCKGLPLAVVVVAGVLKKKRQAWKEVAESLSRNGDVHNLIMEAMELSYNNLPDYLRPCFLYFGGFPEDKEIPVKKLMWLWVAEGFPQKNEQRSSENIAEDYLKDLISRSLVTVAKMGSNSRIKTCRIHDVLLDFSLAKAKQEKNLLLLDGKSSPVHHDHHQVDGRIESYDSNHGKYRMCIYSKLNVADEWPSSFHVSSLVHFSPTVHLDSISSYMSFIVRSFKSLNVLDLERLVLNDLCCGIELLDKLRLLSVRIQSCNIPASISNLSNLETLIVKGLRGEVTIPNSVCTMKNLRHLHIDKRASLDWDTRNVNDDAVLVELETLSTPALSCGYISRDVIRSLRNLLKLKCIFLDVDSDNSFPELESLFQLESLNVLYYGRKVSHGRFSFPLNLKKLTLSKFQLPWADIAPIGKLQNLEVLKLLLKAFGGEKWETKDDEFQKLKYLKLEGLDIKQWNVESEDHFPVLEKLVVHRCKQLEEIPPCFADITTLEMIEVKWSNLSVAKSAEEIFNQFKEFGDESFKVNIHPNPSAQGVTPSS